MSLRPLFCLLLLWGSLYAPGAQAMDPASERLFVFADTNADGLLSLAEVTTARHLIFAGLDTDRDGYVTAGEIVLGLSRAGGPASFAQARASIAVRDLDGDGRVGRGEYTGGAVVRGSFARADLNRDGRVSRGEFRTTGRRAGP